MHGPKITVCISNPKSNGFECYNAKTKQSSFVKYEDSDHYIALPPTDAQTLLSFCSK